MVAFIGAAHGAGVALDVVEQRGAPAVATGEPCAGVPGAWVVAPAVGLAELTKRTCRFLERLVSGAVGRAEDRRVVQVLGHPRRGVDLRGRLVEQRGNGEPWFDLGE